MITTEPEWVTIDVDGAAISTAVWGHGPPDVVLLHHGLGSVAQWRSVPAAIAERTGRCVLAYDRPGHGRSTPVPSGAWPDDWLHTEARRLAELLRIVGSTNPLLVGHSDGGSIALIHAIEGGAAQSVVALAPHSWVEPAAIEEIHRLRLRREPIVERLERFHDHPGALFEAWSGAWVGPRFREFDLRPDLHRIGVKTCVVQGTADEFATDAQAIETAAAIGSNATCELVPGLRHLLHHDDPNRVVTLVARTWAGLDTLQ